MDTTGISEKLHQATTHHKFLIYSFLLSQNSLRIDNSHFYHRRSVLELWLSRLTQHHWGCLLTSWWGLFSWDCASQCRYLSQFSVSVATISRLTASILASEVPCLVKSVCWTSLVSFRYVMYLVLGHEPLLGRDKPVPSVAATRPHKQMEPPGDLLGTWIWDTPRIES